ncbi:tRNA-guanine transglycosylase DpdA [Gammaproteobacteria bacterium]|jgi:hypothetical protein|nr:tRNA-guanine transglycosylase DpdA [Gammaproteobacteria bacterium]
MKFIYSDSLDYVDPSFDFLNDNHTENREPYWDDRFAHEILKDAPYDGLLVSRAMVGTSKTVGKYTQSQAMRFQRVGAREFLRFNNKKHIDMPIFGDNGAFSYANEDVPPYGAIDTIEFYGDGRFTHGCSVDHIIFEFDEKSKGLNGGSEQSKKRFEITLQLASEFLAGSKKLGKSFIPVGVIQGWSPDSMAYAARQLIKMGYRYLAIGGLVPLKATQIHIIVSRIEDEISRWSSTKLHLLGFAKLDNLHEFIKYKKIASFDSSSPLIRAFKDASRNYYSKNGVLIEYYSALRIPQAIESNILKKLSKKGLYTQEELLRLERKALQHTRDYDSGEIDLEIALQSILDYTVPLLSSDSSKKNLLLKKIETLRINYQKTLLAKPWTKCNCLICREVGIETVIFRGSNRNKRRGIHNLFVFHNHLKKLLRK